MSFRWTRRSEREDELMRTWGDGSHSWQFLETTMRTMTDEIRQL